MTTLSEIEAWTAAPQFREQFAGFFWMRWRRKWGRRNDYVIVWITKGSWEHGRQIRLMTWHSADEYPRAVFSGPLKNPDEIGRTL